MIQEKQKFVMEDLAKVEPAVEEARQGMIVNMIALVLLDNYKE